MELQDRSPSGNRHDFRTRLLRFRSTSSYGFSFSVEQISGQEVQYLYVLYVTEARGSGRP